MTLPPSPQVGVEVPLAGGAYPYGFALPDPGYVRDTRFKRESSEGFWPDDVENPLARRSAKQHRAKLVAMLAPRLGHLLPPELVSVVITFWAPVGLH